MITELLDLADRLGIRTPRAFEPMPVQYFIDLSAEGEVLAITPVFGSTNEKSGEPELGKVMDCPAYFGLKIKASTENEIQATAGGGVSVAEAGHGDVREIFCTEITKGKPPEVQIIELPAGGSGDTQEPNAALEAGDEDDGSPELADDSDSEIKKGKNQHYRHDGWLKQIRGFIESEANRELDISKALRSFIDAKRRLTEPTILDLFALPNPAKAEAGAGTTEEKKRARDNAAKERNAQLKKIAGARFTFRVNGQLLLKSREFQEWWEKAYAGERDRMLTVLPTGRDGFSRGDDEGSGQLTPVFPHIPNVPGGGTYCPLASFDKETTQSFGLGKHTLSMSLTTAERSAAALKWLLKDDRSHCRLGDKLVAIFWAVPLAKEAKPCSHDFAALLNEPDALQVLDFLHNIHGHAANAPDTAQFYCAILSSPKSRITVRTWHTQTLGRVTESAKLYFEAVSLPDVFRPGQEAISPLGELAAATVPPKSQSGPPSAAYSRILQTALFGTLLPNSFLESALTRQSLELAKGCADKKERPEFESRLRARTALIKLYFKTNKEITMNEQTHASQDHPAYLCGRVLALMDKIHNSAHGKSTASSPAGRYYGSASSTPALVFPRLCKLVNIHLEKIGGGLAYKLQNGVPKDKAIEPAKDSKGNPVDFEGLAALIARFSADAKWPRTLSLEDQGRFAIGFYYEKCRKWPLYRKGTNPDGDEPATEIILTNESSKQS